MLNDISNDTVGAPTVFSRAAPTLQFPPLLFNLKLTTENLELSNNDTVGAPTVLNFVSPLRSLPLLLNLKLKTENLELSHPPEVP
jgi:hypothetical protein